MDTDISVVRARGRGKGRVRVEVDKRGRNGGHLIVSAIRIK